MELLAQEVALNKGAIEAAELRIEANRQAIEQVVATQTTLVYDYFYVNHEKITLPGEDTFVTFMEPGAVCAEAGQTIKIFSNISIDSNGSNTVVVLEVRKDGVRVALSADHQGTRGPRNQSVFYKETLTEDCTFDIRIRVANDSILPECVQL